MSTTATQAGEAQPARRTPGTPSGPLRIAVVGCGAVAQQNLLPVLAGHTGVRLVALVDRDEARARTLADAYQVPRVLTDVDVLTSDDVDAVVLATPPAHHAPATVALARRGLHVFVEKPMATTVRDAEAMVAAADEAGVVLSVGLYRRFLPSVRLLKHLIASGDYGAPLAIDIEEGGPYGWQLATLAMLTREAGGGGVLIDIGSHLVDEILFVVPGAARLESSEDNARGGIETDSLVHFSLSRSGGDVPVRMELSRTRELRNSIRIECEQATLELRRADFTQVLVHRPPTGSTPEGAPPSVQLTASWVGAGDFVGYQAFRDQLDDWLGGITTGSEPVLSGRSVVPVVRLIDECYSHRADMAEPWTDEGLTPDGPPSGAPAATRRVLVTGAGGFLGGRTVELLRARYGWDAVALVRSPGSAARLARWTGEIAIGDVCSAEDMARAMSGCDAVVHCAVGTGWPPDAVRRATVEGTRTAAEAALKAGVTRFVHISTFFVHQRDGHDTIDERVPLTPPSHDGYAQAKLAAEQALEGVARQGLSTIVLRPVRIYGPFSKTFTINPLSALGEDRLAIGGSADVPANMVYVDNVVAAIARALEAPDGRRGSAYIVADPEQVSLGEFYGFFAQHGGRTVQSARAPAPPAQGAAEKGLVSRWVSGVRTIATSAEFRGIVRRTFETDPVGTWPRKFWNARPDLQQSMLRRFGADAAVVYRPDTEAEPDLLVYDGENARVSIVRLETDLGFVAPVSRDRAMLLTLEWAHHARLMPPSGS